ncbi:MAG: hypothetical protein ACRDRI_27270 [Pseudonocardiaceae bacterium]
MTVNEGGESSDSMRCEYFSAGVSTGARQAERVIEAEIFRIASSRPSGESAPPHSDERGRFAVQRRMSCSPAGRVGWDFPRFASAGESGTGGSVAETLLDAFDDWVAEKLVEPVWERSSEVWFTPEYADLASVADQLDGFEKKCQELILWATCSRCGSACGS